MRWQIQRVALLSIILAVEVASIRDNETWYIVLQGKEQRETDQRVLALQ